MRVKRKRIAGIGAIKLAGLDRISFDGYRKPSRRRTIMVVQSLAVREPVCSRDRKYECDSEISQFHPSVVKIPWSWKCILPSGFFAVRTIG